MSYKDESRTFIPRWCVYCKERIEIGKPFVVVGEGEDLKEYHVECYELLRGDNEDAV